MTKTSVTIYVNYDNRRWKKYDIDFEKVARMALGAAHPGAEVSITLTDDRAIRKLNRKYRGIDRATNVLSFELGDDKLLGDIFISLDTVMREAAAQNISVADHVAHMVVHGVLHLLGYDHIDDGDAVIMENMEIKILKKLGIKNPYADDACAGGECCPGGRIVAWWHRLNRPHGGVFPYIAMMLFGGLASLGFAPFNMWWATLIGIGTAYWIVTRDASLGFWAIVRRACVFGGVYSVAMFCWTLHSIYVVPEIAARFAVWTVPGAIGLFFAGALIFSPALIAAAATRTPAARPFVFAGIWTTVLWLREWAFTGFPWNPIANITMPMPYLSNSMSVWGALGLTFIITGFVAGCVEILRRQKCAMCMISWLVFVLLICIGCVFGMQNIDATIGGGAPSPTIRIVQPARAQSEKINYTSRADRVRHAQDTIQALVAMSADAPDLVVYPETTYPFAVVDDIFPMSADVARNMIIGATAISDGRVYNSMLIARPDGRIADVYNKSHLVPFGEYAPMGGILPAPADMAAGAGPAVISIDVSGREFLFAPAICYEIIFSDSLIPRDAPRPDAIINITNDTWFMNTPGIAQHLDMVRRYAIESGIPVVRANYSGISAFVGADGEIISYIPAAEAGTLDGFVWGAHDTPYRTIGRDWWMVIILAFACMCAIGVAYPRRK